MTFTKHATYRIEADGHIERRTSEMPALLRLPPVSVTTPENASRAMMVMLLRLLANRIEEQP